MSNDRMPDLIRGDTFSQVIEFQDAETEAAQDMTGASATMTFKSRQDLAQAEAEVVIVGQLLDQVTNTGQVLFRAEAPSMDIPEGDYFVDVQVTEPSGRIQTPFIQKVRVIQDTTTST